MENEKSGLLSIIGAGALILAGSSMLKSCHRAQYTPREAIVVESKQEDQRLEVTTYNGTKFELIQKDGKYYSRERIEYEQKYGQMKGGIK
jgi:hypothetical protein